MTNKHKRNNYHKIHVAAKFIICVVQCVLLLIFMTPDYITPAIIVTILYYFGVNTVAYLLEKLLHLKQQHREL